MKTLRLILMLFILPVCALAQGAQYTGIAQTVRNMIGMGNVYVPIPGASVNVCTGVYTGTACPSGGNVTVYSNQALTTALTQPLTADNYGNFTFWAAPGAYYFTVTGQGAASSSYQLTLPFGISGTYNATAKSIEQVRYADQFATGGSGTVGSPWTGWQTAITSAGSGGAVRFPTGYYAYTGDLDITSPVTLDLLSGATLTINEGASSTCLSPATSCGNLHIDHTSNVTIEGANKAQSTLILNIASSDNGNNSLLVIDNSTHVTVRDLTIEQSGVTGRTGVLGNVYMLDSSYIDVKDNIVNGGSSTATFTINSSYIHETGNLLENTQADGAHFSRGSSHVWFNDNVVQNTGDDGLGLIGYIDAPTNYPPVSDVVATGNFFVSNGTGVAGRGFACDGCTNTIFAHNVVYNPRLACVFVGGEPDSSGSAVATSFPYDVKVSYNTLVGCGQAGSTGGTNQGVYITSARDLDISHNWIKNTYSDGVAFATAGTLAHVTDNTFENAGQRAISILPTTQTSTANARLITELWTNFGDGSPTSVGWSHVNLNGNKISHPALQAIYAVWDSTTKITNLAISGNDIHGSGATYNAEELAGADGVNVSHERIDATTGGIRIASTVGGVVEGNVLSNIGANGGILSISSNGLNIIGNTPGNGIFSDSGSASNLIALNQVSANQITVQSGSASLLLNPGDTTIDNFPNGISSTTGTFSGSVALNGGGSIANGKTLSNAGTFNGAGTFDFSGGTTTLGTSSIASGKTLTNSGTISGGTVNATTLQQGGASVALASQLPLSGSVAGSTTSLAANTCGDVVTQTVTGATTTMTPIVTVSGALPTSGLVIQAAVTSANTVSIEYCNVTTGSVVPAAATLEIRVVP